MVTNDYYMLNSGGNFTYTYPAAGTTRKVITVNEYDEEGRLVKETVTEETYTPQQYWYQPWTVTSGDTTPPQLG